MKLRDEIESKKSGLPITYKQGGMLFQITELKFWEPESMPVPTKMQAHLLIDAALLYIREQKGGAELIEAIQIWFPDFSDLSKVKVRYFKKKADPADQAEGESDSKPAKKSGSRSKSGKNQEKPEDTQEENQNEQQPEPKQEEPTPAPKPAPKANDKKAVGVEQLDQLISAGIVNIWMVGPAGCGKTTICLECGKNETLPVTVIPCGAGTSATTFLGYKYPEREGTPFVHAFAQAGIIVLDEFTSLEAQVAQIVNGALANNELSSTIGTFQRHENCIIIATSNTFGNGADRMYVSNNQLDASTIDRFAGGILEVDYSKEYEQQYDREVTAYVWRMRETIKRNSLRKVASTRSIIAACKLKTAGLDWKNSLTINWTADEKALL